MKKIIIFLAAALMTGAAAIAKTENTETADTQKPFDRGIGVSTTTFIPNGTVGAGVAFS